jgi:hypothetical protein
MGIVGTSCGSLWYICWTTERSKTRLVASHTDRITGIVPIEDTHLVTSSLDGTIRIFQLEDRNEILRFDANGLVSELNDRSRCQCIQFDRLESHLFDLVGEFHRSHFGCSRDDQSDQEHSDDHSIDRRWLRGWNIENVQSSPWTDGSQTSSTHSLGFCYSCSSKK